MRTKQDHTNVPLENVKPFGQQVVCRTSNYNSYPEIVLNYLTLYMYLKISYK
jgi:hypothetical protein